MRTHSPSITSNQFPPTEFSVTKVTAMKISLEVFPLWHHLVLLPSNAFEMLPQNNKSLCAHAVHPYIYVYTEHIIFIDTYIRIHTVYHGNNISYACSQMKCANKTIPTLHGTVHCPLQIICWCLRFFIKFSEHRQEWCGGTKQKPLSHESSIAEQGVYSVFIYRCGGKHQNRMWFLQTNKLIRFFFI